MSNKRVYTRWITDDSTVWEECYSGRIYHGDRVMFNDFEEFWDACEEKDYVPVRLPERASND